GMPLGGPMFDTMVAAHVLDSTRMTYKLDALAAELLDHRCIPIEDLIGRGKQQTTMDTVPVDLVAVYAAEDADVALRLADELARQLGEEGLTDLFANLEMPLVPVLADMERQGIIVDPEALNRMSVALSKRADALREQVLELAGRQFNPDSPKQLAVVLFEDLNLPVLKKTKTGPSTDSTVLEQLAIRHELPGLVLDYRKLTKLLGTYLKALGAYIHPVTGRVHTSFHQAGTATGRLSSSDPNLQNIPIRTDEGREIRTAFVAPPGCVLLAADYSQVELRVLAHLCGDEKLAEAFRAGQDIHRAVAAEVFGVEPDQVTDEQRARAKTVNFGIIYGQTAFGLSVSLRIPRREAAEFINRYRSRFPKIDEFLGRCIKAAKEQGYVETIFGRRRRIAEIDARNPQRRAAAERLAINSVVQGSAADLIKQAMVNIARRIKAEARPSRMLLQIHDELLFELPEEAVDDEREMIVREMTAAIRLDVPLKVDVGVGANWMEAK
ncbi:MAG: DNA polymerase I, partial [Phycisphaerae bacterium]